MSTSRDLGSRGPAFGVIPGGNRNARALPGRSRGRADHSFSLLVRTDLAGVHRGGLRILNPTAHETLRGEDEILVLGTPVQITEFTAWLRERPNEANDVKAD